MRKILAVLAAILFLVGCSNDNQIQISNNALEPIWVNFRAVEYQVAGLDQNGKPGTQNITNIPNGEYEVAVGTFIPAGATTYSISPGSATFSFNKMSTKYLVSFASAFTSGAYAVTWNYSSTDSKTSTTSP